MGDGSEGNGAIRAYYGLAVAALLLPVLVFCGGAWLAWRSVLHDARQELNRAVAVSTEQATRVLDTHLLIAARVDDLLRGLDDSAVTTQASRLREQILALIRPFPEVDAVVVTDGHGQVLVNTGLPSAGGATTAAGTSYFRVLRDGHQPEVITTTSIGGKPARPEFSVVRRRGDDPRQFQGIILVSVSPRYLETFYHDLLDSSPDDTAVLYRADGALLAQYPPAGKQVPPAITPPDAILARDSTWGMIRSRTSDGVDREIAYRRLDTYPVYAMVGRSWHSIVVQWRDLMGTHLIFGIPATLSLLALSLVAARRAQRESDTLGALRAETQRRQLAEDALRQAQKMEAVGRLTGGIAHDFNNHLTVISSNVELLKRRLPESALGQARLADAAMHGVQRAATLTQRLLAFSRQQALDPEPLDARQLVAGMLDLLRRTLGESITVETISGGGLWQTQIDANQLESALLSLAVNARDAMPQGGRLTIETTNTVLDDAYVAAHADLTAGEYVMIAVRDHGTGMSLDVKAHAFEPFFTTKPFGQGTGLGLSMVYGFVNQSGGHVRIDSALGEGTTIRLYLPRYVPQPAVADVAAPVVVSQPRGTGETVLVVEDDDTVRRAAVEALREIGYQVLEAPDAMEAVRLLVDRGGIDLLFTDVGLPGGVDGRALADAAHNIDHALKVLFTTGYTREATSQAGVPDDDLHFLAKPFNLRDLEAKVRKVLDAPATDDAVRVRTEST